MTSIHYHLPKQNYMKLLAMKRNATTGHSFTGCLPRELSKQIRMMQKDKGAVCAFFPVVCSEKN